MEMPFLYFESCGEWRKWLRSNHNRSAGVRLIFFMKETGKPSLAYEEALEEALCFGWIDSIIKKIDKDKYARTFTPRKENSLWSCSNKKRIENLIKEGRMTGPGLAKIEAAKRSGL